MRTLLIFIALVLSNVAQADVSTGMRSLFNNVGAYGSVDGPKYLAAQSRHVFSGGGLNYRAPRQSYQLFSATGPSLKAGCGGIDLYTGSFSFINKDQFVQMLNNIAANSVGLAFKTALCSTSANLCQAIEDLQRTIQNLNRFNIDSCETAKQLVGGFLGSAEQSAQAACQSSSTVAGIANDASEARAMCAVPADYQRAQTAAINSEEDVNKPIEFVGGNLTWEVLNETASALSTEDREFIQSMLGTHVVATVSLSLQYYPPTISRLEELNERKIVMLKCDEYIKCLGVTATTVTLDTSFLELAQARISDIRDRIREGKTLSSAQIGLIASSPVPLLAMIQADAAGATGLVEIASEAVAYAVAHHFLASSLRQAAGTASAWKSRSVNEAELIRTMVDDSRKLRSDLAQEMHVALARVGSVIEITERIRNMRYWMTKEFMAPIADP